MNKPSGNLAKKIIWLASYPKSGNTWLRAFVTALNTGKVDLNNLQSDGIFSSRLVFEMIADLDSTLLFDAEAKMLQGSIFTYLSRKAVKEKLFVKVHDAYGLRPDGEPLIPAESTIAAIYLIRNPLDIAASLANHISGTIDMAIELLNNDDTCFSPQNNFENTRPQFEQHLSNWSAHVQSWTNTLPFPVLVLRYEDMVNDTFNTFCKALNFAGIEAPDEQIKAAMALSSFEQLQLSEQKFGFNEKQRGGAFFRTGKTENWKNELNETQAVKIINAHKAVMQKYGYYITTAE